MSHPIASLRSLARLAPALVLGSLALAPAAAHGGSASPNVLFVSFDTLRRDHVSCYGHDRLTTPRVDELARQGVRFTDCQAVIPVTGPSHVSMMTSLYPQTHGAFRNGIAVDAEVLTLPKILGDAGYATGAVVSGWTLRDAQCGLGASFAHYDDDGMDERYSMVNLMRRADAVTDSALAWHERQAAGAPDQPWFLFVHYFDPHEPYEAPRQVGRVPENPAADGGPPLTKYAHRLDEYDREIRYTDQELGRLLDGLKARGALDDTIVIFTADHGQSFGEHRYGGKEGGHGRRVYQSTLAAPLIVTWPGRIPGGRTSDLPVNHLDLVPTLIELVGLPEDVAPEAAQGVSLASVLFDPSSPAPWGRAERIRYGVAFRGAVGNKWNIFRIFQNKKVDDAMPLRACLLIGRHKVIVEPRRRKHYEVYDLAGDPGEFEDLADDQPQWKPYVDKLLAWYETSAVDLVDKPLTDDEKAALIALGYAR